MPLPVELRRVLDQHETSRGLFQANGVTAEVIIGLLSGVRHLISISNGELSGLDVAARAKVIRTLCEALEPLASKIGITVGELIAHFASRTQRAVEGDDPLLQSSELQALIGLDLEKPEIVRLAQNDMIAVILGESGTGKSAIAKTIHLLSGRKNSPIVICDCTGLTRDLIESELFGHHKGAFTGATQNHPGYFEQANGGTIFIDEIGELPLASQGKLLRVLQDRVVRPVGANADIPIDVRVLAATNRDLGALVGAGEFREDLYFRFMKDWMTVRPLRDRKSDLKTLAVDFLYKYQGSRMRVKEFSDEALEVLLRHTWPGNVRELEGVVERAISLCKGSIILPEHIRFVDTPWKKSAALPHTAAAVTSAETSEGHTSIVSLLLELEKLPRDKSQIDKFRALLEQIPGEDKFQEITRLTKEFILRLAVAILGSKTEAGRTLGVDRKTIIRALADSGLANGADAEAEEG